MNESETDEPVLPSPEADTIGGTPTLDSRQPEIGPPDYALPIQSPPTVRRLLIAGFVGSLAAALLAIRSVAVATLPHILTVDSGINYQEVTDGIPVPRLLNWDLGKVEAMISLRDLSGVTLLLFQVAAFALLLLYAGRTLNPTFRLFHFGRPEMKQRDPDNNGTPQPVVADHLSRTIEIKGLAKTATIGLILGIPVAIIWMLTGLLIPSVPIASPAVGSHLTAAPLGWTWGIRLMVLGAVVFMGFHPSGLGGDFGRRELQRPGGMTCFLAAIGAAWGGMLYCVGRAAIPSSLEPMLTRLQALGTFNITTWNEVARSYLLAAVGVGFAGGAMLFLVARFQIIRRQHVALAVVPLVAAILAVWEQRPLSAPVLASRYDLRPHVLSTVDRAYSAEHGGTGVPDGPGAASELANQLKLKFGPNSLPQTTTIVMFMDHGEVLNVEENGYTIDGLTANPDSFVPVREFLRRRNYRSALSWTATKHLIDLCTMHFDTTAALDVVLDDLSYGPHLERIGRVAESLFFICAATQRNLVLLDKWADPARFAYPDRPSMRLLGDLYRRFGAEEKALEWYRKADMPRSFLKRVRAERPLFHTGHVQGILQLNGRPLAGIRIGLVPWRLNGLPPYMEAQVAHAKDEILSPNPSNAIFGPFQPTPFAFRWISASTMTDDHGAFSIDNLTEGQYRLICTLPDNIRLTPPFDGGIRVNNPPIAFALHYGNPEVDLGMIDLTYSPRRRLDLAPDSRR